MIWRGFRCVCTLICIPTSLSKTSELLFGGPPITFYPLHGSVNFLGKIPRRRDLAPLENRARASLDHLLRNLNLLARLFHNTNSSSRCGRRPVGVDIDPNWAM